MTHSIPDACAVALTHRARDDRCSPATTSSTRRRSTASRPTSRGSPSSAARGCCCSAATRPTPTARGSRRPSDEVGPHLEEVFARAEGRIIVTSFASNIHRVQQVVDAAAALGRKVALVGRSMRKNVDIGRSLGHIEVPEGILIQPQEVEDWPDHKVVVISTGSQGEPLSALRRMAHNDHRADQAAPRRHRRLLGDADPRQRARRQRDGRPALPHRLRRDHHRARRRSTPPATATPEELKLMLNLVRPRYVMPVHGDHKRIHLHAAAGRCGRDRSRTSVFQRRERPAAGDRRARRALRRARAGGDDLRRRRRHRRSRPTSRSATGGCCRPTGSSSSSRPISEQNGESVVRHRGDLPRRAVHRAGRRPRGRTSARRSSARSRVLRRTACVRSTSSSRSCTTTSPPSSTTGCAAGRWCCRWSSRSDRPDRRPPSRRRSEPDHEARTTRRPARTAADADRRTELDRGAVRFGDRARRSRGRGRSRAHPRRRRGRSARTRVCWSSGGMPGPSS